MATILVVDDSAVDRRFVGGILARDGRFEVEVVQVHGQIDRTSPAEALLPVHELHAGDGDGALGSVPLGLVIAIALGTGFAQHGW